MMNITIEELVVGTDTDFIINAYIYVLNRWPDDGGFKHALEKLRERRKRIDILRDLANSAEAATLNRALSIPEVTGEVDPLKAISSQLNLRTYWIMSQIKAPSDSIGDASKLIGKDLSDDIRALRSEVRDLDRTIAAVQRELRERLMEINGSQLPPPLQYTMVQIADYVNDLLIVAEARMENRVYLLERKLIQHSKSEI